MTMRLTLRRIVRDLVRRPMGAMSAATFCLTMTAASHATWAQAPNVAQLLAQCQDESRNAEHRLAACTAIVEQMTNDEDLRIEALMNRGIIREGRAETERAIEDYTSIVALDPTNALARFNRGNAYGRLGRTAEAVADYDKAIELDPKDPDFYINRGYSRAEIGEHLKAVADFDRAIGLGVTDGSIFTARGLSYEKLGRIKEARSDFHKALELAEDDDDARDGLERLSSR